MAGRTAVAKLWWRIRNGSGFGLDLQLLPEPSNVGINRPVRNKGIISSGFWQRILLSLGD